MTEISSEKFHWNERFEFNGNGFGSLVIQLNSLSTRLGTLMQQHLAYPVLHYYHAASEWKSSAAAITILNEAPALLEFGVEKDARPDAAVLRSVRRTVASYLETLASAFISQADGLPPPPALQRLKEAGIPTVDDATFTGSKFLCVPWQSKTFQLRKAGQ